MRLTAYLPINSLVTIHGLCGSQDDDGTDDGTDDGLFILPNNARPLFYSYDVFGANGGVLTRSGASEEATKLLDSLLELRRKDSRVRYLGKSGFGRDNLTGC